MPKKLPPTVDFMAFKCRTLRVNSVAVNTFWEMKLCHWADDITILRNGRIP